VLVIIHKFSRMCSVQLQKQKERKEAWEHGHHKFFAKQALVCIVRNGKPIRVATVVRRDASEMAQAGLLPDRTGIPGSGRAC
jgi:hypothetical protein